MKFTRRTAATHVACFFLAALLTGFAPVAVAAAGSPRPASLEELKQQSKKAAHRHRRMIFNNDGDEVLYTKKETTPEALLALRTSPLLGSQVDSIFSSNSMCFGHALHRSRVMEPFTCTDYVFQDNGLPQLMAKGLDPIQIM